MLVTGSFIADGGEKYITIGNFLPDSLTPYIQFRENNTSYVGTSEYLIGFVGVYDCTGHDFTCNAGENKRICSGEVVQLGTDEDSRRQYQWSPGKGLSDSTTARPLAAPTETKTYYLYVIDEFLQQSYDTVIVEVVNCDIFIPNIFSPNNDGLNDVLYVRGEGIAQLSFVIFNRWGEKVFETSDPHHGWDGTFKGKQAETGVYVYMVNVTLENGQTVKRSGNVTLVR
jgi:gliding motility-associated-like protein